MQNWIWIKVLFITITLSHGCGRSGSKSFEDVREGTAVHLTGRLDNGEGKSVLLEEMGATEYIPIDTVLSDSAGRFEITFYPEELAFYVLRPGQTGYVTFLIEPGETITFTGDASGPGKYRIEGSQGSELLRELAVRHREAIESLSDISRESRELAGRPGFAGVKEQLDRRFDSITKAFRDYSLSFIREHRDSPVILVALYNLYGQGLPVFDPERDLHVYQYVDSVLAPEFSGLEAVELLHAQVTEAEQIMNQPERNRMLKPGQIAPDFVSSRPDGTVLALSQLRGNYVLISFWAGWSHLSRVENPYLVRAHREFGDEPFRILQVSLDENRRVWTDAIREDQLRWEQVSDLRRWESPVADLYYLEKIPSNVLVNPEGKIISIDLFGEELLEKLETIFADANE